ncbi:polysaccharide deacetylase family protein [Pseudoclavibacter sp. 13-3]|uniref:polysaccharide deacetylase family protein n=1 Tax=Pseudoclavibacter sp. 13-3 TaxID=2901228 RepID=UPI001E461212|nr:polysaccharide deacetylase family protein [Pseudoclavibacter sp. 13-3]MCD7101380.1 polysaccharide deacetylase family protein [Pseudoclavibacter sp. 13-3]
MTDSSADTSADQPKLARRQFLGFVAGTLVVGSGVVAGVVTAVQNHQQGARGFVQSSDTADADATPVADAGFGETVPVLTTAVTGLGVQRAFTLDPSASFAGRWPVLTGQDAFNGRVEAWVRRALQDYAHEYARSGGFTPVRTPVPGHADDGSYVAPADAVGTADDLRAGTSTAGTAWSRPDAAQAVGFSAGSVLDTMPLPGSTRSDADSRLTDRAEFPEPQAHGHLLAVSCDATQATGSVLGVQLRATRAATIDNVHRTLFEQRQSVFVDIASGTAGTGASLLTDAGRSRTVASLATLLGSDLEASIGTSKKDAPGYDPLRDAIDRGTLLDDVSFDRHGQLVLRFAVETGRLTDEQRGRWAGGLATAGLLTVRVAVGDDDCTPFGRAARQAAGGRMPWSGPARAGATDAQAARTQVSFTAPLAAEATMASAVSTLDADQSAQAEPRTDGPVRPSAYVWPTPADLVACAAVTFDDGPSDYTDTILGDFATAGSHASFMVEGQHAVIYPQQIRDEIAQGHTVCNHTWDHPALTDLTSAQVHDQLTRTDDAVERICGVRPAHVRPPYGFYDDTVAQASPHPLVLWDVDSLDWKEPGQGVVHDKILREAKAGSIVLMHDVHEPTMEMMPKLLRDLRAAGLTLVNLDTLLARAPEQQTQNVIHRLG